ncbi:hypothetical protein E2C01_072353 [Portunus trituberculatus]|uniref:Uncharacterized protein n=1 Tax=Portunus trituberculatus TaxID=210409 RepID=A0A5B7IAZ2_PORTR|nr:hypothetical protein [Portunus trituberculatus]
MYHISTRLSILSFVESRVQVVLLGCKEDTISPAILIEFADLKIVDSRWSQNDGKHCYIFLTSLVSVNTIQLHFESKRLLGLLRNARPHCRAFWC